MKMKEKRNEYEIEQKKRIFCTPKNTQHTKEKSSQEISTQPIIISIIIICLGLKCLKYLKVYSDKYTRKKVISEYITLRKVCIAIMTYKFLKYLLSCTSNNFAVIAYCFSNKI